MFRLPLVGVLSVALCLATTCAGRELRLEDATSLANGLDPYAEEYAGRFPGQRYPQVVDQSEGQFLFDNFRVSPSQNPQNEGSPWTSALVDTTRVQRVFFMMATFRTRVGPMKKEVGHGQMLFLFEGGGLKTPQGEIHGLINSFEAFRDKGVSFNPLEGLKDTFDCGFALCSLKDGLERAGRFCKRVIIYELSLEQSQMAALLKRSMFEALDKAKLVQEHYHTLDNTCSGNQFRLLNTVLPDGQKLTRYELAFYKALFNASYKAPGKHLVKKGLVEGVIRLDSQDAINAFVTTGFAGLRRRGAFERLFGP